MSFVGDFVSDVFGGGKEQDKAIQAQKDAADKQLGVTSDMFDFTNNQLNPFYQAGVGQIGNLIQMANTDLDREKMMSDYFKSGEYAMMGDQARQAQGAQNEAMGLTGSSAGANAMASIAPQLAQNYMQTMYANQADQFNRVNSMVGMGQNAAAMQGNAAQNYGSQAAGIYGNLGNEQSNYHMAKAQQQNDFLGNVAGSVAGMFF